VTAQPLGATHRDGAGPDHLVILRALFLLYCAALIAVGVVAAIVELGHGVGGGIGVPTGLLALAIGVLGVLSLVGSRVVEKPLDASSDPVLLGSYRRRFFMRLAFAEAPALFGFVAFILSGARWLYLIGGVFSVIGLGITAPTAGNLARDQDALSAAGFHKSLVATLRGRTTQPE
jgi:hypothetical protein